MKIDYVLLPVLFTLWIINKLGQLLTRLSIFIFTLITKSLSKLLTKILQFKKSFSTVKLTLPKKPVRKTRSKKSSTLNFPKLPQLPNITPLFNLLTESFKTTFNLIKNKLSPKLKSSVTQLEISKLKQSLRSKDLRKQKHLEVFHLKKKGRQKSLFAKIFPKPLRIGVALSVILVIISAYSYVIFSLARELPSPDKLAHTGNPLTTEIYDRNGTLLYRLYEGKNRSLVKLDELPQDLKNATIAIEDQNFYDHSGVDFMGILRALKSNWDNENTQGASTITQQLIKNTLLTPDRTWERKIKEIVLSLWAERIYEKDEILQMYFNEVAYGGPAWGVAAASQTYFGKTPHELTLSESTYLAGLPASPTTFSPYGSKPELGKKRQKEVLRRMVEDGYITQKQADEAYKQELAIKPPTNAIKAPHFVMYVREQLAQKYGERTVSQGGLKVTTTLDLKIQEMAEDVVSEEVHKLAALNVSQGAAMVTDAKTGHILAMVGSKDYFDDKNGNFNVATALRQPGSSIKPITYATAFKQGYSPGTILLDTPTAFRNAWEVYAPVNYDGVFHGPVSIRTSLGSSYNVTAVKALALVGIQNMIQTARDMGITTFNDPDRYGLSLTLGGGEVKMVDMMTAYGTFSQNGVKYESQPILKITDADGYVLEDNTHPEGKQVIPAGVAYMISDILSDNKARTPAFGPSSLLNIPGHTVAVKTGTTDDKRDNLTYGYTPEVVVGVWVGNMDNSRMNPALTSGVTGAAPIWNRIMTNLIAERPNIAFERPEEVTVGSVEGSRDLVLIGQPTKTVVGQGKKRIKDEKTKQEKDTITFTDPFSSFSTDQLQPVNP